MKTLYSLFLCAGLFLLPSVSTVDAQTEVHSSVKREIERALDKAVTWLCDQQKEEGYWGSDQYPALTALSLRSIMGHPSSDIQKEYSDQIEQGFSFLRTKVQSDGGIYGKGLASYNTSLSLLAFLQKNDAQDAKIIETARRFIINQQSDFDRKGENDNLFDGGVGYGSTWAHSDLSNTHLALEALYYAKNRIKQAEQNQVDLDWDAAIDFVSKCQNLPTSNKQEWVSSSPGDRGGFVYFPGKSMAGETQDESGKVSLRSYGSMSYAGLLSFIYADMKADDSRVLAVRDWLSKNFSVNENPGMGQQGLYYYYHTMSKALSLSNVDQIKNNDGDSIDWRQELAFKLFDLQTPEGYWVNESGRWWEKDPVLVSCYAILTLERVYYGL